MELAKQKIHVETDTTLSAADKKAKLAELDRKLDELDKLAAKPQ